MSSNSELKKDKIADSPKRGPPLTFPSESHDPQGFDSEEDMQLLRAVMGAMSSADSANDHSERSKRTANQQKLSTLGGQFSTGLSSVLTSARPSTTSATGTTTATYNGTSAGGSNKASGDAASVTVGSTSNVRESCSSNESDNGACLFEFSPFQQPPQSTSGVGGGAAAARDKNSSDNASVGEMNRTDRFTKATNPSHRVLLRYVPVGTTESTLRGLLAASGVHVVGLEMIPDKHRLLVLVVATLESPEQARTCVQLLDRKVHLIGRRMMVPAGLVDGTTDASSIDTPPRLQRPVTVKVMDVHLERMLFGHNTGTAQEKPVQPDDPIDERRTESGRTSPSGSQNGGDAHVQERIEGSPHFQQPQSPPRTAPIVTTHGGSHAFPDVGSVNVLLAQHHQQQAVMRQQQLWAQQQQQLLQLQQYHQQQQLAMDASLGGPNSYSYSAATMPNPPMDSSFALPSQFSHYHSGSAAAAFMHPATTSMASAFYTPQFQQQGQFTCGYAGGVPPPPTTYNSTLNHGFTFPTSSMYPPQPQQPPPVEPVLQSQAQQQPLPPTAMSVRVSARPPQT